MLFNSVSFIIFLPVIFIIHWLLPYKYRWILLLAGSYFFYMCNNPWYGLLLAGTTLIDYYTAIKIFDADNANLTQRKPDFLGINFSKKTWLVISVVSNIGCLVAFKYSAFFYNTGVVISNELLNTSYHFMSKIVIPAGLSFYTFQSLSYTIDVYRNKAIPERNPLRFALFVSFFPQLVAGPLERFSKLMPQFYTQHKLKIDSLAAAVRLTVWGFFKKMVVADRLAQFVDPVFTDTENYSAATFIITGVFFAIQVYCDFSGYTDIATGVAKMFGYNLSLNWRRPLLATSLHDFWQRNHITMTSWFRDYLYISLGGNRCKVPRWLLNIFLVFLISGFWHGASWTFIIWGASHGLLFVIEIVLQRIWPGIKALRPLGRIYFIGFYTVSLLAFRATGIQQLLYIYKKIFSFDYDFSMVLPELKTANDVFPLLLAMFFSLFILLKEITEEYNFSLKYPVLFNLLRPVFYVLVFICIFVFGVFNANEFIYFQF